MLQLIATLHVAGLGLQQRAREIRDERGSLTIEKVLWAIAMIGIALGAGAVIRGYVQNQSAQIQ